MNGPESDSDLHKPVRSQRISGGQQQRSECGLVIILVVGLIHFVQCEVTM